MTTDELYREVVLDHHKHPRNAAPISSCNAASSGMNPSCGDEVDVCLRIEDGTVAEVRVSTKGCAVSRASGSMLAEQAKGLSVDGLRELTAQMQQLLKTGHVDDGADLGDFEAMAGVSRFPVRVKCAMLPVAAVTQALDEYMTGAPVSKKETG
jgi:nitrogen fixation protein NifU and related proteins